MKPFEVILEARAVPAPDDPEVPIGAITTRRVLARSAEHAVAKAAERVRSDLLGRVAWNDAAISTDRVCRASWKSLLLNGEGRGFSFFLAD